MNRYGSFAARVRRLRQLAALAGGLHRYLDDPLDLCAAREAVRRRLAARENNFLAVARDLIYANPASPYLRLLEWAGWAYPRVERSVRESGIEGTLGRLRDSGVYVDATEFKSQKPIVRPGLTIVTAESDFDNPSFMGRGLRGRSSGTRSIGTRVLYDWRGLTEEAADERILYEIHGAGALPLALWLPAPPGVAGFRNLLIHLKCGKPPERWFSQVRERPTGASLAHWLAIRYLSWECGRRGMAAPAPEYTPLADAVKVADWLAGTGDGGRGPRVLRAFTSAAIRVAETALGSGREIAGNLVFTGGEALTDRRRSFLESAGLRVISRYASAEAGLIAGACDDIRAADEMHVYTDRIAVVGGPELLFTGLSVNSGKVLFNTALGDCGDLHERRCGCLFGALGMSQRLSGVHSPGKMTGEGVSLFGSGLDNAVGRLVEKAGGSPNDYQFWETNDGRGIATLVVVVHPRVPISEREFAADLLRDLQAGGPAGSLMAEIWRQAETLRIVRSAPEHSAGAKLVNVVRGKTV